MCKMVSEESPCFKARSNSSSSTESGSDRSDSRSSYSKLEAHTSKQQLKN